MNYVAAIAEAFRREHFEQAFELVRQAQDQEGYRTGSLSNVILFYARLLERKHVSACLIRERETRGPQPELEFKLSPGQCTVVVPCFNEQALVANTISSFKSERTLSRIVCVDDGSNDGTLNVLKQCAAKDSRVVVVQHRANSGLGAARNTGLIFSDTEFTCFIDSDDPINVGGVDNRVKAAQRLSQPFEIGVYGACKWIYGDVWYDGRSTKTANASKSVSYLSAMGACPFNANQPLFRTSELLSSGGFPEDRRTAEDWPFWQTLLREGYVLRGSGSTDVTYRQKAMSMIRAAALEHLRYASGYLRAVDLEVRDVFFSKPFSEYRYQMALFPRAVQFFAIHKASNYADLARFKAAIKSLSGAQLRKTSTELSDELERHLPDLEKLTLAFDASTIADNLRSGFARGFSLPVDELAKAEDIEKFIRELGYDLWKRLEEQYKEMFLGQSRRERCADLLFLPHKTYHVDSIAVLQPYLDSAGLSFLVCDISSLYRDEGVREACGKYNFDLVSIPQLLLRNVAFNCAVCFNDWDRVVKPFIRAANNLGIPTVGIIEGVNDYNDVDTGRQRYAYRTVKNVLLPGIFEKRYFSTSECHVCGILRLDPLVKERRWCTNTEQRNVDIVVNVNFTYGVLENARDQWVQSIAVVCRKLGIDPVLSFHPQDHSREKYQEFHVSNLPLLQLLHNTKVFITRFSGTVYEALLSGSHVIYFNPGIEKVDLFTEPQGAFDYAVSDAALEEALARSLGNRFSIEKASSFLEAHAAVDLGKHGITSAERTVKALKRIVDNNNKAQRVAPRAFAVEFAALK